MIYRPFVRHLVITVEPPDVELVSGFAWFAGAEGIEERAVGSRIELVVAVADPADLLMDLAGRWVTHEVTLDPDEWVESWKPWARAVVFDGLVVRPPWVEALGDGPEVVIDPGRAWGHGAHPTTRLILEMLVHTELVQRSVLDVGCGSGVLSIATARLGAGRIVGIDVDPEAVIATRHNASINSVDVAATDMALSEVDGVYDVVIANIDAPVLCALGPHFAARVEPTGVVLLSGLLADREAEVVATCAPLRVIERRELDGWVGLRLAL